MSASWGNGRAPEVYPASRNEAGSWRGIAFGLACFWLGVVTLVLYLLGVWS